MSLRQYLLYKIVGGICRRLHKSVGNTFQMLYTVLKVLNVEIVVRKQNLRLARK